MSGNRPMPASGMARIVLRRMADRVARVEWPGGKTGVAGAGRTGCGLALRAMGFAGGSGASEPAAAASPPLYAPTSAPARIHTHAHICPRARDSRRQP